VERHPALEPSGHAPQQPAGEFPPPARASEAGETGPAPREQPVDQPPPDRGPSGSDER
jgi:hypothetical protein